MKKLIKKIKNAIFVFTTIWLLFSPKINTAAAQKTAVDGTFIQSWFCYAWNDARWQKEFAVMNEAGMHYLILQAITGSSTGEITETYYPSSLPNTVICSGLYNGDMVGTCLKNAEEAGIKVFIGLSSNDLWWGAHGEDTTWFYEQMNMDNKICDELWELYKDKYPNAFYGWYWSYEVDNLSFKTEEQQNELITGINIQLDHLNSMSVRLPIMWSPFMNSDYGTPEEYEQLWENVFSKIHTTTGDIFAPQDCVGGGGLELSEVESWFTALRKAVDTKPGLQFWSNSENFEDYKPVVLSRFISQMQIEQQYVENFVTFSYCHYYSPYNTDSGYHNTYVDYLTTGSLETSIPSTPSNFTAVLKSGGMIELDWDSSEDNIGICGYYIYRNDELIDKIQLGLFDGNGELQTLATNYTDASLLANTDYTYQVKSFDFAGNTSESAPQITINTGNSVFLSNIVSRDCSYNVSIAANGNYPDMDKKELTDGVYALTTSESDSSWEGVYSENLSTRNIVIDLGEEKSVQQFVGDFLYSPTAFIYLPSSIKVGVSKTNRSYTDIGYLTIPAITSADLAKAYKCMSTLLYPVSARYVRFTVTPQSYWTFTDEYEVRNDNTTVVESGTTLPEAYLLMQNYPNPFNPSTVISYQLSGNGFVTLKVFDILGKEIKTLVNKNQNAGNYSVLFDAAGLSSGIYFYQLNVNSYSCVKKLVKLK